MGADQSRNPLPRTDAPVKQRASGRIVGYEDSTTRGRRDEDGSTIVNITLHTDGVITGIMNERPLGGRFDREGMTNFHRENC